MKLLFAVSECVPFAKSGGLADVAGALPRELVRQGVDLRVIMPKYGSIETNIKARMQKKAEYTVEVGWRKQYCGIEELEFQGVTYYFVDNEYYFMREELYGYFDDGERFAFFCKAVLDSLSHIDFQPDIIHCHDWHTGMVPFLLRMEYQEKKGYEFIQTVFTIHNLLFQGIMPRESLKELFGLQEKYDHVDYLEFYGCISFMKGAIVAADKITTVSPTYKSEIQTSVYGEKLHELLQSRSCDLVGILNGIDMELYNPEKDPSLFKNYSWKDLTNKRVNKEHLQERLGLPIKAKTPIIAMVTRLTEQKGIDLVKHVFHELIAEDIQFIILGSGDDEYEHFFRQMEAAYPNKCKAYIGFDEGLAHEVYAGADLFLMPSRFEPCGLGQMIAMRYGTVPIVRETGGLNDTVNSFNELSGQGNGFSFSQYNAHDMLFTIERALSFYRDDACWINIVQNAMAMDYSWAQSAVKYKHLYCRLKDCMILNG
ncbi:glycogen synthase GlgA [Cytobacillus praedii]|uniref:glycogen synthase GlgA n=1 Tax=Cytobacillus praedii TaxID=1742358 RepID=UPI002E23C0FA|nr:glycogen synthase GlgA [Cytobacillus praedii]MED3549050.1 glycogen synthase GlgA [Cytobacillus praedii]